MRTSGVLMHISSLPSPWGIGTFGKAAYRFIDFLAEAGQTDWQILPLGQTSYGDSPYQSFSTFAGNPYFIDLDQLAAAGLLQPEEYQDLDWGDDPEVVDYGKLYENRYPVLRLAASRYHLQGEESFFAFCAQEQSWLEDYALFMALKDAHGGVPWYDWEEALQKRWPQAMAAARSDWEEEIRFWKTVQFWFFSQWRQLKEYANERGIRIVGDVPIYVAADSVDVWANPQQFQLDEELKPLEVAGCPPDGFSELGQLWGNPLFRWDYMAEEGYSWWLGRIAFASQLYDVMRIDHFRGFDSYYAIPRDMTDARVGRWQQGPGIQLFRKIEEQLGRKAIIAEDLGFLTDSVRSLVKESGFPGMKVLQFAFDTREESDYLPYHYGPDCVVYTGTHDNDTILGWMENAPQGDVAFAKQYFRSTEEEGFSWAMMRGALESVGKMVILTMQDILELGGWARMNIPSTIGCNWKWRMKSDGITPELTARLREYTQTYGRLRK